MLAHRLQFGRKRGFIQRPRKPFGRQRSRSALARAEGCKHLARGRVPHRSRGAVAHGHIHGGGAFFHTDDGRAVVAPDRGRHGVADALGQRGQLGNGQAHRVHLLQADQAQLHGQGAQAVVAAHGVLLDQAQLAKAHQVGVGLGGRHVRRAGQVLERHAPAGACQHLQQLAAHLHALDAARAAGRVFIVGGGQVGGRRGHGAIVHAAQHPYALRVYT
ncbi:hypothetical protein D3C71_1400350 [compost metagenome]